MANYYGMARTNYFEVKDFEAFKEELDNISLIEAHSKPTEEGTTLVSLYSEDEAGWVWTSYDKDTEEDTYVDWSGIFTRHLVDGSVAIVMEIGNEKLRYLSGLAIAYNNKGESKAVSLEDIYELAKTLGSNITTATY